MAMRWPVVLIHGVGLDHTVWTPVISELCPGVAVRAPDLLGHGRNRPAPAGVTLADLADEVVAGLPARAHLVGFSLGALVAQHIARHHPDRVASLTSVSSVCRRTPAERAAVLARLAAAEQDYPASIAASLHRWYDGTTVPADHVENTRKVLASNDPSSFLACYRVFATGDAELADELGAVTAPALAITGSDDPGSTPEMTHRLARALPNCAAVIVPNVRHMLPVQCPELLARHLLTLLEGHACA
ncbi:MAG: alpha/beta fold hydrolase [Gordonia sp. (in: high G+C Gram-positive bacteria)]